MEHIEPEGAWPRKAKILLVTSKWKPGNGMTMKKKKVYCGKCRWYVGEYNCRNPKNIKTEHCFYCIVKSYINSAYMINANNDCTNFSHHSWVMRMLMYLKVVR